MSALRKSLKRPETYLALLVVLVVLGVGDTFRSPANQVTARLWVGGVRVYQAVGRPLLKDRVRCRYEPTCSDYSVEAVQKHGVRRGLVLTVRRINSCRTSVPMGTHDPVPAAP
ncbi:MAG TPA: membrane protein insertion efficiency factor YidD [Pyrinomonadaceae bacterium]|nr:membrane protein insertion efficiency factor YidD [Pyrinomonadaceae bacterium]